MKVLYVINGLGFSLNSSIGGSDKRALELIRHLKGLDPESSFDILTTETGYNLFVNSEKLNTKYFIIKKPFWWPMFINKTLFGRTLSYIYSTFLSLIKANKYRDYDLYFATSDFFFDVIPTWFFKLIHRRKTICMIHHHIKPPSEREGTIVINTLLYLSQKFSYWFISKAADIVFLYDTPEGENINSTIFKNKNIQIEYVKNGIDTQLIDTVEVNNKIYEACFVGGLRHSKGIMDFVPIWKDVIREVPKAKFLVIGGGSSGVVNKLKNDIEDNNLNENIILTGPLSGTKLFTKIKYSKIFLFPSYEEGWGISICEAMYCGLPVVCYDLPAYKTFGEVLDKCNLGNTVCLSQKIIQYLKNSELIENKKATLVNTAKEYTWGSIAKDELKILNKLI